MRKGEGCEGMKGKTRNEKERGWGRKRRLRRKGERMGMRKTGF